MTVSDYLTVSETAKEPPQDEDGINCPQNLAVEATYVNQNFSQQMLIVSQFIFSKRVVNVPRIDFRESNVHEPDF